MASRWLNLFFRYSGYTFSLKQKIIAAEGWLQATPYAVILIISELGFAVISLPMYLIVNPQDIEEEGIIFPHKQKAAPQLQTYTVRRKISLATFWGAGSIFVLKLLFIGVVSSYLLGVQTLLAATQDWDFSTPADYVYNSSKIEVTGGVARLKDIGGTTVVTTTNPGFNSGSTGWTYMDWKDNNKVSGAYAVSGGMPGGYVNITMSDAKNKTIAGLWRQSFATPAASPTTATLSFDWKSITFTSPTAPVTYRIYAYIDTNTNVPTGTSTAIWNSGEITSATAWASSTVIDISGKVPTIGTYTVKLAAYVITPNVTATYTYVVGFDNIVVNWSKTTIAYASDKPTTTPVTSLTPVGVTNWNSFTETATKNGGEINYQLSSDDGVTWKYWNGSAWAAATTTAQSNTASVVNANISAFSAAAGKIKWKAFLVSDGSQQVILDNVSIGYVQNAIPSIQNLAATQNISSGFIQINYNLQDGNSDPISLANYEYSLTGAFAGEQSAMTPAVADPAHSGITGLSSSPAGTAHAFVWNAKADLGNIYSTTVYVRLRANDGIIDSDFAISPAFTADYIAPAVSNPVAAQAPASTNVQISYDLFDNTADNILLELQVSSDGGLTWVVPVSSVSGDIGSSVASGNGRSIIWQAGVDFAGQENDNMMVRIRAKDKYQNQGGYVDSAGFILDNRAPAIATPADLLAQPLAGATAVLIGGSFAEGHPNTNDFYARINGGSYGSAAAGDADTATPSNLDVPVGATLRGNDYISAVKITHTDDFGLTASNENTSPSPAYKYVKPYTPPAPSISTMGEDSLLVTINQHPSEADGLEYALFESTQNLYAQSDGSLASSPYWQAASAVTLTGLSQPLSQYIFKVKSRNTSDASHAAASESDLSSGASSNYQSPQITINSAAQTTDGSKYVVINYTGTDSQNQANDLTKFEYSLNGADWQVMTEKAGVGSDGVASLAFTSSGAGLVFAWDVGVDLPDVEDSTVYVRLESTDSITSSNLAVSSALAVDTSGPVVSTITAAQMSGTDNVSISYDLADGAGSNNTVVLSVSNDSGATYAVATPSVSGEVGAGITAGLARNIIWNAGNDFTDQEKSTMKVKIAATDSYGNAGNPAESADFSVDTKAPIISAVLAAQASGSALVAATYNLADLSLSNVEFGVSSDSGVSWAVATTTYTGDMGASQAAGAKSFDWNAVVDFPDQESDTMRLRVRAIDNFGHQGVYQESADFSLNTKVLSISNITVEQNLGAKTVAIRYDLNKNASISLDISSDSGTTWDVATTTLSGQIGAGIAAGNNKAITWVAGIDFNNQEKSTIRLRLRGIDAAGTISPYYESADFSVDTAPPLGLLSLSKFASTDNSATLNWSAGISDAHFNYYELWHGASEADVINRSGAAAKWSVANDANLSVITTISTNITGLNLTSDYYVKIWAIDDYGNEATTGDLNLYAASVPAAASAGGGWVDMMPPAKPILSPLKSPTNILAVNISGLAEAGASIDLYDQGVLLKRLDKTADNIGQFSQMINFSEGEHVLTAKAVDASANESESSDPVALTIKTVPPKAPIVLTPKNGDRIAEAAPVLIGVAEPLSQIEITLDGKTNFTLTTDADGAWQFKVPADFALTDGAHSFVLIAIDRAGNKSSAAGLDINKITPSPVVAAAAVAAPAAATAGLATTAVPTASPAPLPSAPLVLQNIEATELAGVPVPTIAAVNTAAANGLFTFSGTSLPNSDVIVYVHSDQALIYRAHTDSNGIWTINHSQAITELAPGEHTIYAVTVDADAMVKSQPSAVSTFVVKRNFWVMLFERLNLQTTAVTLFILLLTILWLYRIRKLGKLEAV